MILKMLNFWISTVITSIVCCCFFLWFDVPIAVYFHGLSQEWWVGAANMLTEAGDSKWTLVPSLIIMIIFWRRNRDIARKSWFVFVSIAGSGIIVNIIKVVVCRFRPIQYFEHELYGFDFLAFIADFGRNSFPSGHSATALSVAVSLGLLLPKYRTIFWVAGIAVAFSRIVIAIHYCSDVLAGMLIGVYWTIFMHRLIIARKNIEMKQTKK